MPNKERKQPLPHRVEIRKRLQGLSIMFLTARSAVYFFCQNIMSNFRKTIETQKAINGAVEEIFRHFRDVISYAETLETMADAQVELMELMEINRTIAANSEYGLETVPTDNIVNFIHEANQAYRLLRPFAKLMGQVYGNEE